MSDIDTPKDAAQVGHARSAAELKAQAEAPRHPVTDQTPHDGMKSTPNARIAASGAFDAEGQRPVLERSRKAR